jgi:hypothetical protein
MPWVQRGHRLYFYESRRIDGKPRRVYRGTGSTGRLHELLTSYERRQRAKLVTAAAARKAEIMGLKSATRRVWDMIRQLFRAARLVYGEYQHKGQWRRRGEFNFTRTDQMTMMPSPEVNELGKQLTALNDRANRGDRSALAELEELLDRHPAVWQTAARLSADTAAGWSRLLGDGGAVTESCTRREVTAWKAGLCGQDPAPLVTAAVDAAGVAWLAQRFAERELFGAGEKKRAAAVRQLAAANRQVQDALKLVMAARAAAESAAKTSADSAAGATSPRLFEGAAG